MDAMEPVRLDMFVKGLSVNPPPPPPPEWGWRMKVPILIGAFVCGFFTQFQAVAPCIFLFHALFLAFMYMEKRVLLQYGASWFLAVSLMLSMSQTFRVDGTGVDWDWLSVGVMMGLHAAVMHVLFAFAKVHLRLTSWSRHTILLFAYPSFIAMLYAIVCDYTPLASQASMAHALIEWQSLVQFASVLGLSGLNFMILLVATCIAHTLVIDKESPRRRRNAIITGWISIMVVWLFGSFRMLAPSMYQRSIDDTAIAESDWVDGVCLVRTTDASQMVARTRAALEDTNVKFVIWSEVAAGDYYDDTQGDVLASWQWPALSTVFADVKSLAAQHNATIGVTYAVWANPDDSTDGSNHNMLTFFDASEGMIANYSKRYPVPVLETGVVSGTEDMIQATSSVIGDFNAAICFDFDHPEFIRSGASSGLLVQTANTWSNVGYYHAVGSSFRAIENGMYLLRCGSNGPSGLYDPYGTKLMYQERKDDDALYFQVPRNPERMWTLYSHAGFAFDYVLFGVSALYLFVFLITLKSARQSN